MRTRRNKIRLDDDLGSVGIWVPIETGLYTINDVLESNLSMLSPSMKDNVVKRIHELGLKFDSELTIEEMQERSEERDNLNFKLSDKAHRIDFAYQSIIPIEDFMKNRKQRDFAMKNLPYTDFMDNEEAEAWLRLVDKQRKLIEELEKENNKILNMLKNKMNISINK